MPAWQYYVYCIQDEMNAPQLSIGSPVSCIQTRSNRTQDTISLYGGNAYTAYRKAPECPQISGRHPICLKRAPSAFDRCALNAHFLRCAMLYTGCGILPVIRLHTSKQICCILYTYITTIRRDGSSAGRICAGLPASTADFIALSG